MIFLYESDVICSTSTRKDEIGTSPSKIHHMEFSKLTNDPQSPTEAHTKPTTAPNEYHAKRVRRNAVEQHPASTTPGAKMSPPSCLALHPILYERMHFCRIAVGWAQCRLKEAV